ncbi:hypothetical protein BIW11_01498 [Tropilaelaps mercedesae]|uniref:Mediator of RNA polymerase II transcription subunit 1 n=1 Tax=Tropilaelaps mercedesae TaxID=418985 RepID=A0A1V9XDG1_9ACAR|nr:hypothetical protein BIW11_01498 [Tropilaelaps mercedesae]
MVRGGNAANIMDRLRVKQYRPWNDISRLLRQLAGEKHLFVDTEERCQLQRCLDLLQKSIKINSAQGMIERLDTITRQLGLKLTKDQKRSAERKPVELFEVFISSDMFYVEVVVESNGHVCDVKVAHHGDPVSCPELCRVLQENDFVTFTAHLEGLIAIYQLNCEKSRKQKAYVALQALESDLSTISELQKFLNDPRQLVCKSPVGILQTRRGGFPMQLTFFVSPYDLIDPSKPGGVAPFTVDSVLTRKLGQSVSISIENSGQHKLQTGSLITSIDGTNIGKMPNFGPLSQLNSVSLPACFTMKLATPMPLDSECIKKIQKVTGIEIPGSQATSHLIELITKRKQGAYFVKLPDQDHTYHMNGGQRKGAMISSIPFTHPTHVPPVLEFLRQQSLFNSLISSCVRDQPSAAPHSHVFEVQASSLTSLCVSFEHPLDNESLVTLEISLVDILGLKCKAYFCSQQSELNQFLNEDAAAKVLQLSFSIPVLMRSILKKAKGGSNKPLEELQSKSVATPSFLPGGPSGDVKREHFDGENVPSFGDTNGPRSMQQDLFDLENINSLQGGLSLNMLADDGPTSLVPGRPNPYQQQGGGASNGSGGPVSQMQRKRPREDGDFLDNRPPGFPLGAAGGPITKGQLENINNNNSDSNQQMSQQPQPGQILQSTNAKSVGDQLAAQIKRQRTEGPMEDGGLSAGGTGALNNVRDSKNLRAGGDSGESPPAKTSHTINTPSATGGVSGHTSIGGSIGGSSGSSSHGIGTSSTGSQQQQQSAPRKEKSSSSSSGGTSSKSDDKRNSSSSSSSSRDKEKRKDKDKSYSKDGSSKSSSSKSSSKDKDHKTSSKSSSSKDKDKEKSSSSGSASGSTSRGSSGMGLTVVGDKVQQGGVTTVKFSPEIGSGGNASPNKYGSSSSSSSEGQQFTVKSSSSAQGIKLTINKARTSETGGGASSTSTSSSSSSSSSKHNRDSPKPRSLSSSPSHKSKMSPSWKTSPKHSSSSGGGGGGCSGPPTGAMMMPPPPDVSANSSVELVEQCVRALHGDDSTGLTVASGAHIGPGGAASPFDSRSPVSAMGPPSVGSSSLGSVSRPSPVVIDDELMDEALCGMKNHV